MKMKKRIIRIAWKIYCILIFIPYAVILFILGGLDAVSGSSMVDYFTDFHLDFRKKFLSMGEKNEVHIL
jgi:hypothetical protein